MDVSSIARSLASGTTYLKDPVEELLGHPAAQVISAGCVTKTVQEGCRLLTHYTTGAKARDKPYRWMVLRHVPWNEVLAADPQSRIRTSDHPEGAWHGVVHELTRTDPRGAPIICASFFLSNFDAVFEVIREKFELLDEDDPRIIEAALQDEDFCTVLQLYFNTGSKDNPKFFHTLATTTPVEGQTLLHYCCEHNFKACVRFLLQSYTPQTAPSNQPWLQLADPLWQERAWKNSAFSIAAYRGYAELLSIVWTWAVEHHLTSAVLRLTDKKGKNLCEIVEDRLRRLGSSADACAYVQTFNVIAEAFGKARKTTASSGSDNQDVEKPLIIIDVGEARDTLELPFTRLSLQDLATYLEAQAPAVEGAALMILRLAVAPGQNPNAEKLAADRLFQFLAPCTRVSFVKCSAQQATTSCMVRSATAVICSGAARWRSLGIVPSVIALPEDRAEEKQAFAQGIDLLIQAVVDRCGTHTLAGFDMPPGAVNYFPAGQQHLSLVLSNIFAMKRVAFIMANEGQEQEDLRRKLRQDSTAHNPLLSAMAVLERKLLKKSVLMNGSSVSDALEDSWRPYISKIVGSLVVHTLTVHQWAPLLGLTSDSADVAALLQMADEAMLYLLKMRSSSQRPGLGVVTLVKPFLDDQTVQAALRLTTTYCRERSL